MGWLKRIKKCVTKACRDVGRAFTTVMRPVDALVGIITKPLAKIHPVFGIAANLAIGAATSRLFLSVAVKANPVLSPLLKTASTAHTVLHAAHSTIIAAENVAAAVKRGSLRRLLAAAAYSMAASAASHVTGAPVTAAHAQAARSLARDRDLGRTLTQAATRTVACAAVGAAASAASRATGTTITPAQVKAAHSAVRREGVQGAVAQAATRLATTAACGAAADVASRVTSVAITAAQVEAARSVVRSGGLEAAVTEAVPPAAYDLAAAVASRVTDTTFTADDMRAARSVVRSGGLDVAVAEAATAVAGCDASPATATTPAVAAGAAAVASGAVGMLSSLAGAVTDVFRAATSSGALLLPLHQGDELAGVVCDLAMHIAALPEKEQQQVARMAQAAPIVDDAFFEMQTSIARTLLTTGVTALAGGKKPWDFTGMSDEELSVLVYNGMERATNKVVTKLGSRFTDLTTTQKQLLINHAMHWGSLDGEHSELVTAVLEHDREKIDKLMFYLQLDPTTGRLQQVDCGAEWTRYMVQELELADDVDDEEGEDSGTAIKPTAGAAGAASAGGAGVSASPAKSASLPTSGASTTLPPWHATAAAAAMDSSDEDPRKPPAAFASISRHGVTAGPQPIRVPLTDITVQPTAGMSWTAAPSAGLTTSKPLADHSSGVVVSHDTAYSASLEDGAIQLAAETCAVATGPDSDKHLLAAAATEAAHTPFPSDSAGAAKPLDHYTAANTDGTVAHKVCHTTSLTLGMGAALTATALAAGPGVLRVATEALAPAAAGATAVAAAAQ